MAEIARAVVVLVLVALGYGVGEWRGRAHQGEVALAESAAVVAELEAKGTKLVEAERRIEELQTTAATAGTQTRTIIRHSKDLAAVPVPDAAAIGLRAQMARTARFGTLAADFGEGGSGSL